MFLCTPTHFACGTGVGNEEQTDLKLIRRVASGAGQIKFLLGADFKEVPDFIFRMAERGGGVDELGSGFCVEQRMTAGDISSDGVSSTCVLLRHRGEILGEGLPSEAEGVV